MSTTADDRERIEELAAAWLAERGDGLTPARRREFDRWCRADPRHAAAVARLEEACALLEEMPRVRAELLPVVEFPRENASSARESVASRGRVVRWAALGFAAALAVAAVGWWQWPRPHAPAVVHATTSGGYERVVLADGSVVELNANTEVRVDFAPDQRRVTLVAGEAHFTVAHNPARPFVVGAGRVSVRAVGTAFNVRRAPAAVEVLVTEGRVAVNRATSVASAPAAVAVTAPAPASELAANERLLVPDPVAPAAGASFPGDTPPLVEKISPEVLRAALAWQERKLVFAETPLREVVAQFNRRNRLQIVIADPALGDRRVGGTFAADNAEGFVRLLEGGRTLTVERRGEFELVLHAAR